MPSHRHSGPQAAPRPSSLRHDRPATHRRTLLSSLIAVTIPAVPAAGAFAVDDSRGTELPTIEINERSDRENDRYNPSSARSATRMDVPLRDTPQTVNVITGKTIRDTGAQSMEDVLRGVPGVGLSHGDGQRDQVTLRGFSAIGDQYVDGLRDDALYFRDLSGIERVEVVKGPAAVLYGRGSAGGLINRITKTPGPDIGEASLTVGSWNRKRIEIDAGRGLHDGAIAWRLPGAIERSGGYRGPQFIDRHSLSPSVTMRLAPRTELTLHASTLRDERVTDFGVPALQGRPVANATRTYFGAANARDADTSTSKVDAAGFSLDHRFDSGIRLHNRFRYYGYQLDRSNTLTASVNEAARTATLNHGNVRRHENGLANQLELTGTAQHGHMRHTWLVGAEFGRQTKRQWSATTTNVGVVAIDDPVLPVVPRYPARANVTQDNRGQFETHGIYAQDLVSLTPSLKLLLGIRHDRFRQATIEADPAKAGLSRTDKAWSPRAGLVWQPDVMTSWYASWSRSFQPSAEMFPLGATNADLAPERTTGYELGVRRDWLDAALTTSAALFQIERNHIKTTDPVTQSVVPIGVQRVRGLELTAAADLRNGWHLTSGYAWTQGRMVESVAVDAGQPVQGKWPTLTPRHSASLWVTRTFGDHWMAGGGMQAISGRWANPGNTVRLPGYAIVDLVGGGRWGPVDLRLNVHNLFDRAWFVSGHGTSPNLNLPGAPRTIMLTARFRM